MIIATAVNAPQERKRIGKNGEKKKNRFLLLNPDKHLAHRNVSFNPLANPIVPLSLELVQFFWGDIALTGDEFVL